MHGRDHQAGDQDRCHEQGGWPDCHQAMHLPHSLPERIEKIHNNSTAALFIANKSGLSFRHTIFSLLALLHFFI